LPSSIPPTKYSNRSTICGSSSVARANGDHASDYLLVQSIFLPFNAKVDPKASKELADTIRAANQTGF
jgi:hypothetical protein